MQFCPKCGAILVQKNKKMECPRCTYASKANSEIKITEKLEAKKEIPVLSKDIKIMPVVSEKCKKCKNEKAYFWTIQTRSGDEAETKFFKCTKCDYTWKDYR